MRMPCGVSFVTLHLWQRCTIANFIGVSVGATGDAGVMQLMGGIGLLLFDDLLEVFQGEFVGIVFW